MGNKKKFLSVGVTAGTYRRLKELRDQMCEEDGLKRFEDLSEETGRPAVSLSRTIAYLLDLRDAAATGKRER